jgi:hypothetical protein
VIFLPIHEKSIAYIFDRMGGKIGPLNPMIVGPKIQSHFTLGREPGRPGLRVLVGIVLRTFKVLADDGAKLFY